MMCTRQKHLRLLYLLSLLTFLCTTSLTLLAANKADNEVFNVKKYGAVGDGKTDDAPAFKRTVEAAILSNKPATVFVPAGTYLLKQAMGRGMIEFKDAKNIVLEGEKNTLIIVGDPHKHAVHLLNSENITVRQLEIDRNPLTFTQGIINDIDIKKKTVDITIDKGYDEPDAQYLKVLKSLLVFTDPEYFTWDHSRWWPSIKKRERTGPMKWRLTLSIPPLGNYKDKQFIIWNNVYKGWGIVCTNSKNCLIEDVRYYGGGTDCGYGAWKCSGTITYRRFYTGIPEGSDRMFACAAGSMLFHNRCTFILDDCDISRVDDDCLNMGTLFAQVAKQIDPKNIVVKYGNITFEKNDTITLWDWFDKKERSQAIVVDVKKLNRTEVQLSLDKPVQVLHPIGSEGLPKLENWDARKGPFREFDGIDRVASFNAAGKAIIRNCRFQTLRARNLLIKTSNTLIENCTFYDTHMASILVGPEFYWGEAPQVRNLTIRNNKFVNIDGCSINIGCFNSNQSMDNKNILIENNTFESYGAKGGVGISGYQGTAVLVRNADGVIIRNNKFGKPAQTAPKDARPLIVEVSKNVVVEGNTGIPDVEY